VSVERAVERALAKDPADRFGSTLEFVNALRETGSGPMHVQSTDRARTARRAGIGMLALLVFALGAYALSTRAKSNAANTPLAGATAAPTTRVSLAVLPLANLSADPDNRYFSEGMLEDLLVALNRVPRLNVAPRTSSFRFKDQALSLSAIAESLHVSNVVEGSIRRDHNTVRISARLVRLSPGSSDSVLWADDFTRDMKNVLSLQSELADKIATQLLTTLLPADRAALAARTANNPEAYDRYLKGRYQWYQRTTPSLLKAVTYYREALAIDSGYARAYAGLADVYSLLPWTGGMRPVDARPLAAAAAERAVALDSLLPEAHVSVGIVRTFMDWDWDGAERAFAQALLLDSNSTQALLFRAWP
jgi:TolB-like protein